MPAGWKEIAPRGMFGIIDNALLDRGRVFPFRHWARDNINEMTFVNFNFFFTNVTNIEYLHLQ